MICGNKFSTSLLTSIAGLPSLSTGSLRASQNPIRLLNYFSQPALVGEMTLPGATDGLAFKTYVTQVLVPNLWSGACVVMDNLAAHKVTGIRSCD